MNADLNRISEAVIGCAYRASRELGSGFLESVYENAMALELAVAGVQFDRQKRCRVDYRDQNVGEFVVDLLVEECLIVEIKAVRSIISEHQAQLLNYQNVSALSLGLLIKFGTPRVQIKRMVNRLQE